MKEVLLVDLEELQTAMFPSEQSLPRSAEASSEGTVWKHSTVSIIDLRNIFRDHILKSIHLYQLPGLYLVLRSSLRWQPASTCHCKAVSLDGLVR